MAVAVVGIVKKNRNINKKSSMYQKTFRKNQRNLRAKFSENFPNPTKAPKDLRHKISLKHVGDWIGNLRREILLTYNPHQTDIHCSHFCLSKRVATSFLLCASVRALPLPSIEICFRYPNYQYCHSIGCEWLLRCNRLVCLAICGTRVSTISNRFFLNKMATDYCAWQFAVLVFLRFLGFFVSAITWVCRILLKTLTTKDQQTAANISGAEEDYLMPRSISMSCQPES